MSNYKIILTRPLTLKELAFGRLIKPFEDKGMVEELSRDRDKQLEFFISMIRDHSIEHKHFEHILTETYPGMTVTECYQHLDRRDEYIPPIYVVKVDENGRYYHFRKAQKHRELEALVKTLHDRNILSVRDHFFSKSTVKETVKIDTKSGIKNLFELSIHKKLPDRIDKKIENDDMEGLLNELVTVFPNGPIVGLPNDLLIELADIVVALSYEVGDRTMFLDYLYSTKSYLNSRITEYNRATEGLRDTISRQSYNQKSGIINHFVTRKERACAEYSDECIRQVLEDLELAEAYEQYMYGYYHTKTKLYHWLINLIRKTIKELPSEEEYALQFSK